MSTNLTRKDGCSVVDIGCGSGRLLNEVVPLMPKRLVEVFGLDMDEEMINFCRSRNTNSMVNFDVMNIEVDDVPKSMQNRFDLLISSYCFSHVRNLR